MVDINRTKEFFKSSDIHHGDIVRFTDPGVIEEVDFSREQDGSNVKAVLKIGISVNEGDPKPLTMGATGLKTCEAMWGTETDKWVGKSARAIKVKTKVFGETKDVLEFEACDIV